MKQAKFKRKARAIQNLETGAWHAFPSINKAKKESRKLQPILGDGTVRVIPTR
jgi:hypothetical protein